MKRKYTLFKIKHPKHGYVDYWETVPQNLESLCDAAKRFIKKLFNIEHNELDIEDYEDDLSKIIFCQNSGKNITVVISSLGNT
ncbi:MAG: hypothetical protein COA63_014280 [Methylophaga sp.]|nr:hypothetical protein [Methylophaga sp.]